MTLQPFASYLSTQLTQQNSQHIIALESLDLGPHFKRATFVPTINEIFCYLGVGTKKFRLKVGSLFRFCVLSRRASQK